jgi:hypothetical protein
MSKPTWIWWKPLLIIAALSLVAVLFLFKDDVPREIVIVIFVVGLVAASKVLRVR